MTECWVMNKYHPFLGLLLQLKCIASSQLVGTSAYVVLSHTQEPLDDTAGLLFHTPTQSSTWDGNFSAFVSFLYQKNPWNTQTNKNTKPKQQQQQKPRPKPLSKLQFALLELTSTLRIRNQDRKLDVIPSQPAPARNISYQLKAKPLCVCRKIHLYYYLLCVTAVLPQIGAILIYSNCLGWPNKSHDLSGSFLLGVLKHFAYTP